MDSIEKNGPLIIDHSRLASLHSDMVYLNSHGNFSCVFCDGRTLVFYADANGSKDMWIAKIDEDTTLIYTQANEKTLARMRQTIAENPKKKATEAVPAHKIQIMERMLSKKSERNYMEPIVEGLAWKPVKMEADDMRVYRDGELVFMNRQSSLASRQ